MISGCKDMLCHGRASVVARRNGEVLWQEDIDNLIVDAGLDDILDKYFRATNYTASHFIGLTSGSPTIAAGDTMASHAGWTEVTDYSESSRPAFVPGAVSGQSVSGSAARFTISTGTTTGGAFVATDSTKGGAAGTLVSVLAFTTNRTLAASDTLDVTWTYSSSSA